MDKIRTLDLHGAGSMSVCKIERVHCPQQSTYIFLSFDTHFYSNVCEQFYCDTEHYSSEVKWECLLLL